MAKPTQAQRDEVRDLVRWIYARSGAESWSEFARRAEVLPSSMSDWSRGENAPSSYNLVKLMRAAGIIQPDAQLDPDVPNLRPSYDERLEEILRGVTELLKDQKVLLDRLPRVRSAPPKAQPGTRRKR